MKKTTKKVKRKNPAQVAKGKKRAQDATRNEKGWFVRTGKEPARDPAESPAHKPAGTSSLYITTNSLEYKGHRDFELHVDKAMKDEYWLMLMAKRTGLPFRKRKSEITEIFKGHVVRMGKEEEITSEKKAKAYFNNFARRGTPTHRETREELRQGAATRLKENPHRYEDVNPITGERTYYGIQIPAEAPPRPTAQAVYSNNQWIV